jgi:hypothetical protein
MLTLIKTFKLRNKLEIDVLVNDELFLTITRPFISDKIDTNDIIHFDLLDGYAEMYPNENQPNSFIYFSQSGGNQMALVLTENEAHEFLKLTDNIDLDSDYEPESDTESDATPTQSIELEEENECEGETQLKGDECCNDSGNRSESQLKCDLDNCCDDNIRVSGELQTKYIKVIVLDRKPHPSDSNFYIYKIDIGINQELITCVSEDFYKVGDLVNVDCYRGVKGISYLLSEYTQEEPEIEEINSRFASWFGF